MSISATFAGLFAAFSALLLAGCNGGGGSTNPSPCTPPNGIRTVLVYPAPGSTGIPDNLGAVVLGSTAALPSGFQAVLANDTTGNTVVFNVVGTPRRTRCPRPTPSPSGRGIFRRQHDQRVSQQSQQRLRARDELGVLYGPLTTCYGPSPPERHEA
jgi:hypothetical protein